MVKYGIQERKGEAKLTPGKEDFGGASGGKPLPLWILPLPPDGGPESPAGPDEPNPGADLRGAVSMGQISKNRQLKRSFGKITFV